MIIFDFLRFYLKPILIMFAFMFIFGYVVECESERECRMLGNEMGMQTKEYFGIPCLVKTKNGWVPARNIRWQPNE